MKRKKQSIITVSKEFHFEAAHSLPHLPKGHKCRNLHGHSYRFRVVVGGHMNHKLGWLVDYADISAAVQPTIDYLDHQNLNEILPCKTTAENLAFYLWNRIKQSLPALVSVEVFETASTSVYYRPEQ